MTKWRPFTTEDAKNIIDNGFQFIYGFNVFESKREIEPTGRLTILGKELTVEETKNYLKANAK